MLISLGTSESIIMELLEVPLFGTITVLYIMNTRHKRIFLRIKDSTDVFKPVVNIFYCKPAISVG